MRNSTQILVSILGFNALSAIVGSIGLVTGALVLPAFLLRHTPFTSFIIPGLILGIVVGGSSLFAIFAVLVRTKLSLQISAGAGFIMIGWIVVETILIQGFSWLQGLYLLTGLAVSLLAILRLRTLVSVKPVSSSSLF